MKKNTYIILLFSFLLFYSCTKDDIAIEKPIPVLEKLFSENELANSYKSATGYSADFLYNDVNYFGIYPMVASGNRLYLGLGRSIPAATDGAALATYAEGDNSLTYLKYIPEQGIMTFTKYNNAIAVPGADPCCGDVLDDDGNSGRYNNEWDWGNFYSISTQNQTVTKHRNLPNVVHGWGSWFDTTTNTFYYAGSGHMADTESRTDATTTGFIFKTTNSGQTWTKVADRSDGIGLYRTYDIIGIQNRLYAQFNDELSGACSIAKSLDNGQTWTPIPNSEIRCATRLYTVHDNLVALSTDTKSFIIIDASDAITTHPFDAQFQVSGYHIMSIDPYGNIYTGTKDGRVMHTVDFDTWTEIAHLEDTSIAFTSSTYWEEKQWLVLANWGENANLWKIPIINSDHKGLPDILE